MRAQEFLTEEYDPTKARVPHPEDRVFDEGSAGAQKAIATLQQMASNPETISVKPDGKPAIVWGRDERGFTMCDKHMFAKGILPRSPKEIADVYAQRRGGGREELSEMIAQLWPQFEASLPNGFKGYLFGDLLYSQRPPVENGSFVFKPNTVVYTVETNSELGQRIAKSNSGIVVHTFFSKAPAPGPDGKIVAPPGRHISTPKGTNPNGPLVVVTDQFTTPPRVKIPPELKSLSSFIASNGALIDKVVGQDALSALKIRDLPQMLMKYTNGKVRQRSFDSFGSDFLQWLDSEARVSDGKKQNIKTHLQANAAGFKVMCQTFIGIMRVKNHIVGLLDSHPAQMQAHINGEPGQEGYMVHGKENPTKVVNRERFSAANFEH
jgi:hypothetical protein